MRTVLAAAAAVLLALPAPARAESGPLCDTSSDETAARSYERVTGQKIAPRVDCFARAESFPGVVSVGKFAHDRGCRWTTVLDLCAPDPAAREKNAAARAMASAGWATAKEAARGELALKWLTEVMHAHVQWNEPTYWKKAGKPFDKPTAKKEGNGIVARFWASMEAGMTPVYRLVQAEVRFDARGVPGAPKVIAQLEIPIR